MKQTPSERIMTPGDISRETWNVIPSKTFFVVPGNIMNAALVKKFGKTSIYLNPYGKGSNFKGDT